MTLKQTAKVFIIAAWAILACYLLNLSLELLTAADTLVNIAGVFLIISVVLISIKIYNLSFKSKPKTPNQDEKSN